MKRLLQVMFVISALLMFFRFGGPALLFGATGPGPFGNQWLADGKATLLLDADLRFFGAMMIGLGFIFLYLIAARLRESRLLIYLLACAIAVGAAARIYSRITFGDPGTAGTIPVLIETLLPIFFIVLTYLIGKGPANITK